MTFVIGLSRHHHDVVFILRSVNLHGTGDFTGVVRAPRAWMHYDGSQTSDDSPHFLFYPLDQAKRAMHGRDLDTAACEVVPGLTIKSEKDLFGDYDHNWSESFYANNAYPGTK